MSIKSLFKPLISTLLSLALAFAVVNLPARPALAGSSSSGIGGNINYLLPLIVVTQIYMWQLARMNSFALRSRPMTLVMPLSDGTRVLIYVHKGKMIGYAHTY